MRSFKITWDKRFWIPAILVFFMAVALIIRLIPALFIKDAGFLYTFSTDSWYNLRQIEVMVNHFPQYNWFDPMTAFPTGKVIDWGPFFPFIAATLCLITGATTHSAIIYTSGWVLPLMATVMVPVMYIIGKTLWNWKAGIVAAGLISIVSAQYFSMSSYGWVDHHIAEVLFTTLFFLAYLYSLAYGKQHTIGLKNPKTLFVSVALPAFAGILYFLALVTSTTVIYTLLVIAVYTLIQNVLDYFSDNNSVYLLVSNFVFLSISTILLVIFGFRQTGVSLTQYSIGIVYVNLGLITGTVLLFIFSTIFHGKKIQYLIGFAVLAIAGFFSIQIFPMLQMITSQATGLLFGSSVYSVAVLETFPWTMSSAWGNFNGALILMLGGLVILAYYAVRERNNGHIFLLVWSVVMLILTVQYQRFLYYFTINVVLLAAICITESIRWRGDALIRYFTSIVSRHDPLPVSSDSEGSNHSKKHPPAIKQGKKKGMKSPVPAKKQAFELLTDIVVISVIILTIGVLATSISQDIGYVMSTPQHELSPDWVESLAWLQNNTPHTGIDYFKSYEATGFSYPHESYGIMAVWDAGHWITFFSHRIPITNPFQDHLGGSSGTAAYFLSQNESQADDILQSLEGRYVITNSYMAIDMFPALVPWQSNSVDISPYIKWFMISDVNNPSRLLKVQLYEDAYFCTMVARLHNFDGSMQVPNTVYYVQYVIRNVPALGKTASDVNGYARVITSVRAWNRAQVQNNVTIVREGTEPSTGQFANVFSDLPNHPVQEVLALKHYRLIHESPDNASVKIFPESDTITLPDIKYVKIFEYVKGAHIPGDGVIEVPIVTNNGRMFVYRQVSESGEFVVPYSTSGNIYEVRTTGSYHIAGTNQYINVTEADVIQGNRVAG